MIAIASLKSIGLAFCLAGFSMPSQADGTALSEIYGPGAEAVPVTEIAGWDGDDHEQALAVFQRTCAKSGKPPDTPIKTAIRSALADLCLSTAEYDGRANRFFEDHFLAVKIAGGFLTGYFEPELEASRERIPPFIHPLYRRPADLVDIRDVTPPEGWDPDLSFGRFEGRRLVPYHDRKAIDRGALVGKHLEIAYLNNPVDALFVHIQGSARLRFKDGTVKRIAYAGKSGHPYTPIGRVLVERGKLKAENLTADTLRAWLKAHPHAASEVIWKNRSFIFFREVRDLPASEGPVGAAGVSLTAHRSLAVDKSVHIYGSPIWLDLQIPASKKPETEHIQRLMVAQDTGSAIVGAARGDIFFGSGPDAGRAAGRLKHPGAFFLFLPRRLVRSTPKGYFIVPGGTKRD